MYLLIFCTCTRVDYNCCVRVRFVFTTCAFKSCSQIFIFYIIFYSWWIFFLIHHVILDNSCWKHAYFSKCPLHICHLCLTRFKRLKNYYNIWMLHVCLDDTEYLKSIFTIITGCFSIYVQHFSMYFSFKMFQLIMLNS